jgi:6-phosphogluconolactonase
MTNRQSSPGSIAIFAIDQTSGALSLCGHESSRGTIPRNFTISADGSTMVLANQETRNVVSFEINQQTGSLSFVSEVQLAKKPTFVGILEEKE